MDETEPFLHPSLNALLKDLPLKQIETLYRYCEKHNISITDFIDSAVIEAEKRYLSEHQSEAGNGWMRETLRNPIFRGVR